MESVKQTVSRHETQAERTGYDECSGHVGAGYDGLTTEPGLELLDGVLHSYLLYV